MDLPSQPFFVWSFLYWKNSGLWSFAFALPRAGKTSMVPQVMLWHCDVWNDFPYDFFLGHLFGKKIWMVRSYPDAPWDWNICLNFWPANLMVNIRKSSIHGAYGVRSMESTVFLSYAMYMSEPLSFEMSCVICVSHDQNMYLKLLVKIYSKKTICVVSSCFWEPYLKQSYYFMLIGYQ